MEVSINEDDGNKSFRSPPRRRRSTFFDRRESFVPQSENNIDSNVCKQITESNDKSKEDLIKYHKKLLSEKEQWKDEVKSRRNKYNDLKQQFTMAVKAPGRSSMSYSALTKEDIEFLEAKANIAKLFESQQKLHKSVKLTRALCTKTSYFDELILSDCEQKINEITEHILENSTIDAMDKQM